MNEYLKFIDRVDKINQSFQLNQSEIELLNLATQAHCSEKSIFVADLINQEHIGPQITLNMEVKGLINKNLLMSDPHNGDGCDKIIFLTKLALDRLKKLNQATNLAVIQ